MKQKVAEPKKQKIAYLEALRIIACFFVIVNHTVMGEILVQNPGGKKWLVLTAYFFLCKIAVPLYLMISGVLFLGHVDSYRKCFGRIVRIVLDIVIFSLLYYVRSWYVNRFEFSFVEFLKLIARQHMTNAYWYLYLYLGLLIMLPLLQRLAAGMGRHEYQYLLLFAVVFFGTMPIFTHYIPGLGYHSLLTVAFFPVYVGIVFMGYYLANHVEIKSTYAAASVVVVAVCVLFQVGATYQEYLRTPDDYMFFDDRTFLPITLSAAAVFYLARWIQTIIKSERFWCVVTFIGGATFGTYLLSDLLIELYTGFYIGLMSRMNIVCAVVVYQVVVFVTGILITLVLKRIPYVKKLL